VEAVPTLDKEELARVQPLYELVPLLLSLLPREGSCGVAESAARALQVIVQVFPDAAADMVTES